MTVAELAESFVPQSACFFCGLACGFPGRGVPEHCDHANRIFDSVLDVCQWSDHVFKSRCFGAHVSDNFIADCPQCVDVLPSHREDAVRGDKPWTWLGRLPSLCHLLTRVLSHEQKSCG